MYRMDVPFRAVVLKRYTPGECHQCHRWWQVSAQHTPCDLRICSGRKTEISSGRGVRRKDLMRLTSRGVAADSPPVPQVVHRGSGVVEDGRGLLRRRAVGICRNSSQTLLPAAPRYERLTPEYVYSKVADYCKK